MIPYPTRPLLVCAVLASLSSGGCSSAGFQLGVGDDAALPGADAADSGVGRPDTLVPVEGGDGPDVGPPPCAATLPAFTCPPESGHALLFNANYSTTAFAPLLDPGNALIVSFPVGPAGRIDKLQIALKRAVADATAGDPGEIKVTLGVELCPDVVTPLKEWMITPVDGMSFNYYYPPAPPLPFLPAGTRYVVRLETMSKHYVFAAMTPGSAPMPVGTKAGFMKPGDKVPRPAASVFVVDPWFLECL